MKKKAMKRVAAFLMALAVVTTNLPLERVMASQVGTQTEENGVFEESTEELSTEKDNNTEEPDGIDGVGNTEETEGTGENESTEENKSMEETDDAEGTESVEEIGNTEEIGSTEEIESTEKNESAEEVKNTEDNKSTEEYENTEEAAVTDYLIDYVVVDKESVSLNETQEVVVGINGNETVIDSAILNYKNIDTGEFFHTGTSGISMNAARFSISFEKSGTYQLDSISFVVDGVEYTEYFSEAGIDARFGVEVAVEVSPDAIVVEPDVENADVDIDVVTFDENGNQISENSIESALSNAQDETAANSIARVYSLRAVQNKIIVLDPGHDNTHAGAQANGLSEEDLNLKIALYCKEELEKYSGVTVYLTRAADGSCPYPGTSSGDCNLGRVDYAKSVGADAYVSIHNNSATTTSAKGAMVFYPNANYNASISQTGKELAQSIQDELVALGLYDRGIEIRDAQDDKYPDGSAADYYSVIRNSKLAGIPAIIIEHTFMTNTDDVNNFLTSDAKLKALGVADATGIASYYGLTKGLEFTAVNLSKESYTVGEQASLTYATNDYAYITVEVYNGDNSYLRTLVSKQLTAPGNQSVSWDLKDNSGNYVYSGQYRFTITATNDAGEKVVVHKYFQVIGNEAFAFKWTNLSNNTYVIEEAAELYYAVNRNAKITVNVYYGNNIFLRTLLSEKSVGTNDQVVKWDLRDRSGDFVESGTYRFSITAEAADGTKITVHKYFKVTGNDELEFRWTNLSNTSYAVGNQAELYYATNRKAKITVNVYDGNNIFLKNLVTDKQVATNDQVVRWDLKNSSGKYVNSGTYRFSITAEDSNGTKKTVHKYFKVTGNDPLAYKWTNLSSNSYAIGNMAELYYATNQNAKITVNVYDGNNIFLRTLVKDKEVKTNDQVVRWDLKKSNGNYVDSGKYRFSISAEAEDGTKTTVHKYFTVTGNDPVSFKWTNFDKETYAEDTDSSLAFYYAVTRNSTVSIDIYYGNNSFMKNLVTDKAIGTNDQVAYWDFRDKAGTYVESGTYRFTITAIDNNGNKTTVHKYFQVDAYYAIMGNTNTSVEQMAAYYNANQTYPDYYKNSDAPTIEDFCQIYMEECEAEGVRAEVAFAQAMKETGFLRFKGQVKIEQYNFAGIGAVDSGETAPATFSSVREGVRAQVQHLKAYASTESLRNECVDPRFQLVKRGTAPYVEWLGIKENPYGAGWATSEKYGYSIKNDYINKLMQF